MQIICKTAIAQVCF